jgi:hypothetical protein
MERRIPKTKAAPAADAPLIPPAEYIKALRRLERGFSITRDRFIAQDVRAGGGWAALIGKLEADSEESDSLRDQVPGIYRELSLLGARIVRMFAQPDFPWKDLAMAARAASTSTGTFGKVWPLLPPEMSLASLPVGEHELVDVREAGPDVILVFACRRMHWTRQELQRDKISPKLDGQLLQALGEFDRLVAIRHTNLPSLDVVVIRPKEKLLEIRLDHPKTLADKDDVDEAVAGLLARLETIYASATELSANALNLFPAMKMIYAELPKARGKVIKLKHLTEGGSTKQEAMHLADKDLRDEKYHHAGAEAIGKGNINPYAIGVEIEMLEHPVRLLMAGRFTQPLKLFQELTDVHIENCFSHKQFTAAIDYLLTFKPDA